jgi:hypothetical protein
MAMAAGLLMALTVLVAMVVITAKWALWIAIFFSSI